MNANDLLVAQIPDALDAVAATGVLIPCRAEITDYLLHHPDTAPWLVRIARAAREQLPHDAQLSLGLFRDPESDDTALTLHVRQRRYAPDLTDRTHAIMAQFEHEYETCSGWILLSTDFQPPRYVSRSFKRISRDERGCCSPPEQALRPACAVVLCCRAQPRG